MLVGFDRMSTREQSGPGASPGLAVDKQSNPCLDLGLHENLHIFGSPPVLSRDINSLDHPRSTKNSVPKGVWVSIPTARTVISLVLALPRLGSKACIPSPAQIFSTGYGRAGCLPGPYGSLRVSGRLARWLLGRVQASAL